VTTASTFPEPAHRPRRATVTDQELLDGLRGHGVGFVEACAAVDTEAPVPTCPGWTVTDLALHLGVIWHRFGTAVERGWVEQDQFGTHEAPEGPSHGELETWLRAQLDHLLERLVGAGETTPVWNWTGADQHAGWVLRRVAHENVIHHIDAASAGGAEVEVDPALAADGVGEFFDSYLGRYGGGPLRGTVALRAADRADRWFLTADGEAGTGAPPRDPVATVSGPAPQLLRWVWRRPNEAVITGDAAAAHEAQAYCFPA
jgi:uncharacterized protein (TIGR03083 family)